MTDVLVLCYHAVSPAWPADLSVTPESLERQLSYLVARGWRGTTFSQAVLDPPARRTLAVTFDDAFRSVLELAAPILTRLGLVGTVFAPTEFMTHQRPLRWPGIEGWSGTPHASELTPMDWSELSALTQVGWEVGSHSRTHPHLTELDDVALERELRGSREEVSDNLAQACQSVAYPYGAVDERVARCAARVGYRSGAGLSHALRPLGPHRWPRVGIYLGDDERRFRAKVNPLARRLRASRWWPAGG